MLSVLVYLVLAPVAVQTSFCSGMVFIRRRQHIESWHDPLLSWNRGSHSAPLFHTNQVASTIEL